MPHKPCEICTKTMIVRSNAKKYCYRCEQILRRKETKAYRERKKTERALNRLSDEDLLNEVVKRKLKL